MRFIEPCLPTISRSVPTGPQWAYEIKHDGFRFLAVRQRKQVRIYSRGGYDWSERLPAITEALRTLPVHSVVLDGEGVICGPDGKSEFDRMRACFSRNGAPEAFLYAFDVLELDGHDMRARSWAARRAALVSLLTGAGDGIRLCEHIAAHTTDPLRKFSLIGFAGQRSACVARLSTGFRRARVGRPVLSASLGANEHNDDEHNRKKGAVVAKANKGPFDVSRFSPEWTRQDHPEVPKNQKILEDPNC